MDPPPYSTNSQKKPPHSANGPANRQSDSATSSNPYSDSGPEVAATRSINCSQETEEFRNTQGSPQLSHGHLKVTCQMRVPDATPPSSCDPDTTSNPYSDSGSVRSLMNAIKEVNSSQTAREHRDNCLLPQTRSTMEEPLGVSAHVSISEGAEDHSKDSEDSSISAAYHPSPTQVTFDPPSPVEASGPPPGIMHGMYSVRIWAEHW